jgi:aconitate hydratase
MVNGIGVLGWGVGGIEAEAGMLGQPICILTPDVVGVELKGGLRAGVSATDAVLFVTQKLRSENVVGKFVEFFGAGASLLSATDRATISNMAPEYGATTAFFAVDENTLAYYAQTGRSEKKVDLIERYFREQGLFGAPQPGEIDYSSVIEIDLAGISPSVAGPKRPQDRLDLPDIGRRFDELMVESTTRGGYGKSVDQIDVRVDVAMEGRAANTPGNFTLGHGDVLIAAITSCTNTSNPELLIAAGLMAKNARERGLSPKPWVKTLFTPGSRVAAAYLADAGLIEPLSALGFGIAAYGCGACVGNIGPLDPAIEETVVSHDLVCSAVLSGNRNFEARIHGNVRANFLASPALVVAFALAGTTRIDLATHPLGHDAQGVPVMLSDLWPKDEEIKALALLAQNKDYYRDSYQTPSAGADLWDAVEAVTGAVYNWPPSTYVAEPAFFSGTDASGPIVNARALAILGDSITTDHISPAGSIDTRFPAGQWLTEQGVNARDFNTYGARRGHSDVMVRGTFANVRLRNLCLPTLADGSHDEGPFTRHQPSGERTTLFEASRRYMQASVPTVIFAGELYGNGSSRDWAAKGTRLLGVRAVIARSFERIHRSNLAGMGVLPLQFVGTDSVQTLQLDGSETFDIVGLETGLTPLQTVQLVIHRANATRDTVSLLVRIDTQTEVHYFNGGGILPLVLERLLTERTKQ